MELPEGAAVDQILCPKCESIMVGLSAKGPRSPENDAELPSLTLIEGQSENFSIMLGEKCSMGRDPDNTCQILDGLISRRHATIFKQGGQYVFRDLGSLNGSFVNNEKIVGEIPLVDGDRIQIGDSILVFSDPRNKRAGGHPLGSGEVNSTMTVIEVPDESIYIQAELDAQESREPTAGEIAVVEDIETVKRAYEKLQLAFELHLSLNEVHELDAILDRVLDMVFKIFPADRGVILLQDSEGSLQPRVFKIRDDTQKQDTQIRVSKTLLRYVQEQGKSILLQDAQQTLGTASILLENVTSAMSVPLFRREKLVGVLHVDASRGLGDSFSKKDLEILTGIGNQIAVSIDNAMLHREVVKETELRKTLGRYLSQNFVEQIASQNLELKMGGDTVKVTVLFSDIRGFTSLSETLEPVEIVSLLNSYFEIMVECIFKQGGTLDKFIGDAIMAVWGSPLPDAEGSMHAVQTALEMQIELAHFNLQRRAEGKSELFMGIGINTGPALSGNIGSTKRMEYTVIGDTVNLASRIEHLTGAGDIILSEFTLKDVGDMIRADAMGETRVKGKSMAIQPFLLRGIYDTVSPEAERRAYPRLKVCLLAVVETGGRELGAVVDELTAVNLTCQIPCNPDPPVTAGDEVCIQFSLGADTAGVVALGRITDVRYLMKAQSQSHHRLVVSVESLDASTRALLSDFLGTPPAGSFAAHSTATTDARA